VHAQAPALQFCPVGQALPHLPQLAALVCASTHTPAHTVFPAGQTQVPAVQT
jgi:hypothetical protein